MHDNIKGKEKETQPNMNPRIIWRQPGSESRAPDLLYVQRSFHSSGSIERSFLLDLVWIFQDALRFEPSSCLFEGPCLYPRFTGCQFL